MVNEQLGSDRCGTDDAREQIHAENAFTRKTEARTRCDKIVNRGGSQDRPN
jgi:hypothetical protein